MNKTILCTFLLLFCMHKNAYCQEDSSVIHCGYSQKLYQHYFDSIHQLHKTEIQNLDHSFRCWVHLKIDTNGSVNKLDLIEIPGVPLPDPLKKYIQSIFNPISWKWSFRNLNNNHSCVLFFSLLFIKTDQTLKQRMKDFENTFEFMVSGLPALAKQSGFEIVNEIQLLFSY